MHDKNGRVIQVGDRVQFNEGGETPSGRVITTWPGAQTCNVEVAVETRTVNASDCELLQKGDGSALAPIADANEPAKEPEPATAAAE